MGQFTAKLTDIRTSYGMAEISILFDNGEAQIRRDYTIFKAEELTEEALIAKVEQEKQNLNALYANAEALKPLLGQEIGG